MALSPLELGRLKRAAVDAGLDPQHADSFTWSEGRLEGDRIVGLEYRTVPASQENPPATTEAPHEWTVGVEGVEYAVGVNETHAVGGYALAKDPTDCS